MAHINIVGFVSIECKHLAKKSHVYQLICAVAYVVLVQQPNMRISRIYMINNVHFN
jgi:hypothetical protein